MKTDLLSPADMTERERRAKARQAVLHREIVNEARDIAALRFVRSGGARGVAPLADQPSASARA